MMSTTGARANPRTLWLVLAAALACRPHGHGAATASPDGAAKGPALACPADAHVEGRPTDRMFCVRADGKRHGPVLEVFPEGGKRLEGAYVDGKKHGDWREFYVGGTVRTEEHYDHGKPVGTWIEYFADGTHAIERLQRDDGLVALRSFRPDGSKLRQGVLVDGAEDGDWIDWDAAGTATTTTWDRGRKGSVTAPPIGIAACDEYVERFKRCMMDKVPEPARAGMQQALDATVKGWKDAAAGPNAAALESSCRMANDAARQAMSAMGCEW